MENWKTLHCKDLPLQELVPYIMSAVSPRPIALASTINAKGEVNLSPFSFFNVFSLRPPILVFSPSRSARNNTTKHTYENVLECPEVVIHMVSKHMVEQTSLSSVEYAKGINEFVKAGFTPLPSVQVKPPRVKESYIAFECKVKQVVPLGEEGGAGNLVICEILTMHMNTLILSEKGQIDPVKLQSVARMGGNWYCDVQADNMFEIQKPVGLACMGIDKLPTAVQDSTVLSGNDLGQLGNVEQLPSAEEIKAYASDPKVLGIFKRHAQHKANRTQALHHLAKECLLEKDVKNAWKVLLQTL